MRVGALCVGVVFASLPSHKVVAGMVHNASTLSPHAVTGVAWSVGGTACKHAKASGTIKGALTADGIPVTAWSGPCGDFSATLQCVLTKAGWLQSYYIQSSGHVTEGTPVKEESRVKCSYLSTRGGKFYNETVQTRCCFADAAPGPGPSGPTPAPARGLSWG